MDSTIAPVKYFYGVGRRKASTARAKYYPTDENLSIQVNKREFSQHFHDYYARVVLEALQNLGIKNGQVHFFIKGGGLSGQAEAARLAATKALVEFSVDLKPLAKTFKYLSTDIRKVLPKRPGLRKARKAEQWSKR